MNEPRWLTPEERETWLRTVAVLELLPAALDAQLHADADLTQFEYMVLAMLSEVEGRQLRMSALAAHTTATLPRLSRVVAGLEKRGFIERSPCTEDRRATNAALTDAGYAALAAAAPGHVETVRRLVIDPLEPEEFATLGSLLGKLLPALDPDGRMMTAARLAAGAPDSPAARNASTVPAHPLPRLAAPAAGALAAAGYASLDDVAGVPVHDLMKLHGIGRSALRVLREALEEAGLEPLAE